MYLQDHDYGCHKSAVKNQFYVFSIIFITANYTRIYPSKSVHIAEGDFREVYCELVSIKARYYQLGIVLGLPPGELEAIRKTQSQDMEVALIQVLLLWLRQRYNTEKYGHPTWQRLREAVDSPAGGENPALAEEIAKKDLTSSMSHHSNLSSSLSLPFLPFFQIVYCQYSIYCRVGMLCEVKFMQFSS